MRFDSTITLDSSTCEGVRFTIRRLTKVTMAKRDMEILDQQVRFAELNERIDALRKPYGDDEEPPLEVRVEMTRYDRERGVIIDSAFKPATIKAALVSIDGYELDGKRVTAAMLLENGPNELIDEVWIAINKHSILTVDQAKNLQSPSTSEGKADGVIQSSTATSADGSDTTSGGSVTNTSPA
jgi:hypothetical protein